MAGSPGSTPNENLALWLAILGKGQALGGSPNPAETLSRIENARKQQELLQPIRQQQRYTPSWIPGTTPTAEM